MLVYSPACKGGVSLSWLRPGDAARSARSTLFFSEPTRSRQLGYSQRCRDILASTPVTVPFVVTEPSTQGALLLKQPGTPLIFPSATGKFPAPRATGQGSHFSFCWLPCGMRGAG